MKGVKITSDGIVIDSGHFFDGMSVDDRKTMVVWACQDDAFIESVLRAVATPEQDAQIDGHHAHDIWFGSYTKTRLRQALTPMLDGMFADEMTKAIERADRYENAHALLRGLAHIRQMRRETPHDHVRVIQWDQEWSYVDKLFPEFAAKAVAA